jgi:TonB family protein
MTWDRTTGYSVGIALVLHAGILILLGLFTLKSLPTGEMPMLIEVTLAGSSAPHSTQEGIKSEGTVIAPRGEEEKKETVMTPDEMKSWRERRRQEIIKELADSRSQIKIGASTDKLRASNEGLAAGRGAGDLGSPGSPQGTLSLTGAIASRGYKEPDFSLLKSMITEETQLRLLLEVTPEGEVKKAALVETSGYPFVDQKAIELARKIMFDPLPVSWKQVEQQGVLTIKLKL